MSNVTDLFDWLESDRRKEEGMEIAAHNRGELLEIARQIAVDIALSHPCRECHADAVGREMRDRGYPTELGPAAGSIFKGGDWEFTGRRKKSARVTNHSRELKIWRYKW